jgi:hypothetical protein
MHKSNSAGVPAFLVPMMVDCIQSRASPSGRWGRAWFRYSAFSFLRMLLSQPVTRQLSQARSLFSTLAFRGLGRVWFEVLLSRVQLSAFELHGAQCC